MRKLLYIFLMCGLASPVIGLTGCDGDARGKKGAIELDVETGVDSAYAAFKEADRGKALPLANHFFYLLDALEITDSLVQYASPADLEQVNAHADYWMGEYLFQTNRVKEARTLQETALREAEKLGDNNLMVSIHSLLTAVYQRLGMPDEALRCLQFCYEDDEKTGNQENLSSDLNNMAALFISLKQYDKAKTQIDRAIEIEERLGRESVLAIRYGTASETYMLLDLLPEAEDFARRAYRLDVKGNRQGKAAIRLSQLASVLLKQEKLKPDENQDFSEVRMVLMQAIAVFRKVGNTYSHIICENQLGDVSLAENDFQNAEKHFGVALAMSEGAEFRYMKQRALQGLWKALKNVDVKCAAGYLEQYTALADSLHSESTERQLANLQAQFEYKNLQAEHKRLVYHHRIVTMMWLTGAVIVLLIITVFCYGLRAKRKKKVIEKQNDMMIELIEESAKEEAAAESEKAEKPAKAPAARNGNDAEFLNKFVLYVNTCLRDGKSISTADCASHLCVSPRHFSRRMMQITGSTPSAYINRIKINRAKRLLEESPTLSNAELSAKCGFDDPAYFGRVFRQLEGVTPQQFRQA